MQIVVNDIYTNYESHTNPKAKETILVLHGWGRSVDDWDQTAKDLNSTYNVVLLDLPGFGGTEKPEDSYTIYDYAEYVAEFIKKRKLESCILMGHSFGGRIGIILASQTDLLKKLVLVDAAGIEEKQASVMIKIKMAKFLKRTLQKALPQKTVSKIVNTLGSSDYNNAKEMREIFKTVVSQDLTHHLSDIKIPTLIIWGENDAEVPLAHAKRFKNDIDGAVLRVVWGTGHFPFMDKYDEFFQVLKDEL